MWTSTNTAILATLVAAHCCWQQTLSTQYCSYHTAGTVAYSGLLPSQHFAYHRAWVSRHNLCALLHCQCLLIPACEASQEHTTECSTLLTTPAALPSNPRTPSSFRFCSPQHTALVVPTHAHTFVGDQGTLEMTLLCKIRSHWAYRLV